MAGEAITMAKVTFHDLRGASVFITGGGSGIGAALTGGFLEQGASVAFVGRSDATAFCDSMEAKHGIRPLFIACDITDIAALHAAMDQAAAAQGPFSVVVNNAADDMRYAAEDVTEAVWDAMQAVNLKAYFFACQKAAAIMGDAGGSIINYSSVSYMMGIGGLSTYISANAAIMGMTRSLAREWGPRRIRVNALAPGWVLTDKQKDKWATPEGLQKHLDLQCLKDFMTPDDVVGGTLFLASDASRMMTGQTLVIDAGVVGTG
jgi:NAD(P)-dependent dehydrogenase (short-subunit alcohol dehydrogenase family)